MALIRSLVDEAQRCPTHDARWAALRAQVREERRRLAALLREARRARKEPLVA